MGRNIQQGRSNSNKIFDLPEIFLDSIVKEQKFAKLEVRGRTPRTFRAHTFAVVP